MLVQKSGPALAVLPDRRRRPWGLAGQHVFFTWPKYFLQYNTKKLKTFPTDHVFFLGSSKTQVFFSWPYLDLCILYNSN